MSPIMIKNYILLASGLLNLAMGLYIISRGWRSKINLYFSLVTFFNFLWAISLYFGRTLVDNWYIWAVVAYPASIGIAVSLFYFSVHFPFAHKELSKNTNLLVLIPGILLSIIFFVPEWFIVSATHDVSITEYTLYHFKPMYWIFAAYFIIIIILAVYNLYSKYKNAEGVYKKIIKILMWTIIIGLIFGTYFDLVICYFGNFRYIWLGPPFTLLMNAAVLYLIFLQGKQIKIVSR